MQSTTIRAFTRAIFSSWFTAMSGSLSVPAAALAVYGPNAWVQIGFAITAFVCVWAAAYSVWAREREARNAAEAKLKHSHTPENTLEMRMLIHNETDIVLGFIMHKIEMEYPGIRTIHQTNNASFITHPGKSTTWFPRQGITGHEFDALPRQSAGIIRYDILYGIAGDPPDRSAKGEIEMTIFKNPTQVLGQYLIKSQTDAPFDASC